MLLVNTEQGPLGLLGSRRANVFGQWGGRKDYLNYQEIGPFYPRLVVPGEERGGAGPIPKRQPGDGPWEPCVRPPALCHHTVVTTPSLMDLACHGVGGHFSDRQSVYYQGHPDVAGHAVSPHSAPA